MAKVSRGNVSLVPIWKSPLACDASVEQKLAVIQIPCARQGGLPTSRATACQELLREHHAFSCMCVNRSSPAQGHRLLVRNTESPEKEKSFIFPLYGESISLRPGLHFHRRMTRLPLAWSKMPLGRHEKALRRQRHRNRPIQAAYASPARRKRVRSEISARQEKMLLTCHIRIVYA